MAFNGKKLACVECGWSPEANADMGVVRDHLVAVHGYIREGGQVFKRDFCEVDGCGKAALYKFGVRRFCGAHKTYAKTVAARQTAARDAAMGSREERNERFERMSARNARLRKIRGKRKSN